MVKRRANPRVTETSVVDHLFVAAPHVPHWGRVAIRGPIRRDATPALASAMWANPNWPR